MFPLMISILTRDKNVFQSTRTFYEYLGFKSIISLEKDSETHSVLHLFTTDNNSKRHEFTIHLSIDDTLAVSDNPSNSLWTVFYTQEYSTVENILDSIQHPYSKNIPKLHFHTIGLYTQDPAGNTIAFTNQPLPFSPVPKNIHDSYPKLTSKSSINSNLKSKSPSTLNSLNKSPKRRIGILTSGGDSSGMNAAVRAITRFSLQQQCSPFAIYEGFQGLVDGGDKIKPLSWEDVRGYLALGGTIIGTARCMAFKERKGRLDAAYNMVINGIDALIVIGGDGSLTGADILRSEWKGLLDELVSMGKLKPEDVLQSRNELTIVGLVGSIDNDMSATDITIGAVTSLHRICESLDSLSSTATSHQRAFVVEVMGRHCGWLALMAGIATGADWVFLPERPPPLDIVKYVDDWESEMCETVKQYRKMGARKTIVIVCEGAIDRHLNPIKPDQVKKVLQERLGLDTRVTTLGHVQRGGPPCAMDRYLGTIQGVEAVKAVLQSTPETPAPMIGMSEEKIISVPLMDAVKLTHSVADAISKKDFKRAMELRDPFFAASFDSYIEATVMTGPAVRLLPENERRRIGILHTGAPAGGMNAATRIAARLCLNRGHTPLGIRNGFSGLVRDEIHPLTWLEVNGWQVRGGSELGTNRDHPKPLPHGPEISEKGISEFLDLGQIAYHLQKNDIHALMIIGGFEAYTSILTLTHARTMFPAFCIPLIQLPATVSNNVPGTSVSVGCDTAMNGIVEACDKIKLSANASRKRVFVVEVQGGNCGYLASFAGLITGAATAYVPESPITLQILQKDISHLVRRYSEEDRVGIPNEGRLILRTESTIPSVYSTEIISEILRAEAKGLFDSRTAILGHLQQGGIPSPFDRIRATRLAVKCIDWIQEVSKACVNTLPPSLQSKDGVRQIYTQDPAHSAVCGTIGGCIEVSSVYDLLPEVDLKNRRTKSAWWMELNEVTRIMAKYEFTEELEGDWNNKLSIWDISA